MQRKCGRFGLSNVVTVSVGMSEGDAARLAFSTMLSEELRLLRRRLLEEDPSRSGLRSQGTGTDT